MKHSILLLLVLCYIISISSISIKAESTSIAGVPNHLSKIDQTSYDLLKTCAAGTFLGDLGGLNTFKTYCGLLLNGLGYKGKYVEVMSMATCPDFTRGGSCLQGKLNVAEFFPGYTASSPVSASSTYTYRMSLVGTTNAPQLYATVDDIPFGPTYNDFQNFESINSFSSLGDSTLVTTGVKGSTLTVSSIAISADPIAVYFAGVATIQGFSVNFGAFLDLTVFKLGLMFTFPITFINSIIDKLLGPAAPYIRFFALQACQVTIATTDITLPYPIKWPSGYPMIKNGIAVSLSAAIIEGSTNPVFKFLRSIAGSHVVTFYISFAATKFDFGFNLDNFPLTSKVTLEQPGILINNDFEKGTCSANLLLNFHYVGSSNDVTFMCVAEITTGGTAPTISLFVLMKGAWNRPFGLNGVTISDVGGNIGLMPIPPFVNEIGLRGTLQINNVIGSIDFNFDMKDYEKDYFYCKMQGLTVSNILNVLGVTIPGLPSMIAQSGYETFIWSFAFKDCSSTTGTFIPEGIRAAGSYNFLGFVTTTDMTVSTKRFKIKIQFPQVKLANGAVVIQESATSTAGPSGLIDITLPNAATSTLAGAAYIKVPLFTISCNFYVSPIAFTFQASVKISSFSVDITASAAYDNGGSFTAAINDGGFTSILTNAVLGQIKQINFNIPGVISGSYLDSLNSQLESYARQYVGGVKVSFGAALSVTSDYFTFTASIKGRSVTFSCSLAQIANGLKNLLDDFTNDIKNYAVGIINSLLGPAQAAYDAAVAEAKRIADAAAAEAKRIADAAAAEAKKAEDALKSAGNAVSSGAKSVIKSIKKIKIKCC